MKSNNSDYWFIIFCIFATGVLITTIEIQPFILFPFFISLMAYSYYQIKEMKRRKK